MMHRKERVGGAPFALEGEIGSSLAACFVIRRRLTPSLYLLSPSLPPILSLTDMDSKIPRPKMPKQALPDSVRRNLGLTDKRKDSKRFGNQDTTQIHSSVGDTKGGMEAKQYLKMKSGVPMSLRTSGLVKLQNSHVGFGRPGKGSQQIKEDHREQQSMMMQQQGNMNQRTNEMSSAYGGQNSNPNKQSQNNNQNKQLQVIRRQKQQQEQQQQNRRHSGGNSLQLKSMGMGDNIQFDYQNGTRGKYVKGQQPEVNGSWR
jgi:hypothetical protein